MKMIAELTAEETVTRILSSREILERQKSNFYISNPQSLGDYLSNLPKEESAKEPSSNLEDSKYTFIKSGLWNW